MAYRFAIRLFIYGLFSDAVSSSDYNGIRASRLSHERWTLVAWCAMGGAARNEQASRWQSS
jgi:hypothetical protein